MKRYISIFVFLLHIVVSIRANALIVFDPTQTAMASINFATQISTLAQQAVHLETQIRNQLQQLENEAKNLERLGSSLYPAMRENIQQLDTMLHNTQGLAYRLNNFNKEFNNLYPEFNTPYGGFADQQNQYDNWNLQTRNSVIDAFRAHSIIDNMAGDQLSLEQLVSSSNNSVGQLQAIQAANEIAALMVKQLFQLQALQAADSRAMMSFIAQQSSEKDSIKKAHEHEVRELAGDKGGVGYKKMPGLTTLPMFH